MPSELSKSPLTDSRPYLTFVLEEQCVGSWEAAVSIQHLSHVVGPPPAPGG